MVRQGARPRDDAGGDRRPRGPRFARRNEIVGKLYRMPVTRTHQKKIEAPFWQLCVGSIIAQQARPPLSRSKRLLIRGYCVRLRNERVRPTPAMSIVGMSK
jgi:hypothetical protein